MVFTHVLLSSIYNNNQQLKFEMAIQSNKSMDKCPWYNKTIRIKLNGQIFEDYLKTGRKYRYESMCYVDGYDKEHVPMSDDASNGGGIPIPSTLSKEALYSLGKTINFIENWIQCFEVNHENRIMIYKTNMSEVFKRIPKSLSPKLPDDSKRNIRKLSMQYVRNGI